MFGRILAALLILLTVLPFTAPFPACDANTLFSDAPSTSDTASPTPSLSDGLPVQASPPGRPTTRIKPFAAVSRAAAGSVRPLASAIRSHRQAARQVAIAPSSLPSVLRI